MAFKLSGFPTHQTKATIGGVTPFKHVGLHGDPDSWDGQYGVEVIYDDHAEQHHGGDDPWEYDDPLENDPTSWNTGDAGWIVNPSGLVANFQSLTQGGGFTMPGIYPNKAKLEEWGGKVQGAVDKGAQKVSEFFAGQGGGINIANLGGTGDFKWPWE